MKPDVVVLNVTMPVLNGFQAAQEIKKIIPQVALVVLSSHADKRFVDEAKKISVRAYVAKSKAGDTLVKAVEAAVRVAGSSTNMLREGLTNRVLFYGHAN